MCYFRRNAFTKLTRTTSNGVLFTRLAMDLIFKMGSLRASSAVARVAEWRLSVASHVCSYLRKHVVDIIHVFCARCISGLESNYRRYPDDGDAVSVFIGFISLSRATHFFSFPRDEDSNVFPSLRRAPSILQASRGNKGYIR